MQLTCGRCRQIRAFERIAGQPTPEWAQLGRLRLLGTLLADWGGILQEGMLSPRAKTSYIMNGPSGGPVTSCSDCLHLPKLPSTRHLRLRRIATHRKRDFCQSVATGNIHPPTSASSIEPTTKDHANNHHSQFASATRSPRPGPGYPVRDSGRLGISTRLPAWWHGCQGRRGNGRRSSPAPHRCHGHDHGNEHGAAV